ncbi:hypothetical protein Vadar_005664 [Vaccinium darrowii]|uniref:Uncharacterized protein n=1 Tax=Vaccinium darrowii TaxID=229202 RepID=A0ACB7XYB1_9ERIC|nr:hypothetical protein Vadar_005664 [Vaccinium darrowii]
MLRRQSLKMVCSGPPTTRSFRLMLCGRRRLNNKDDDDGGYGTLEFVLQGYESLVVKQKGSLAEAFAKHEERLEDCSDGRVKKWREALTEVANLSGWDLPKVANGDMGREIVRQESLEDPGKRSRLCYHDDVLKVLRYGTGTEAVKGLLLNTTDVQLNAKPFEPFEKMDKLWYNESVLEVWRDTMGTEEVEDCLLNLNDPEHVQPEKSLEWKQDSGQTEVPLP